MPSRNGLYVFCAQRIFNVKQSLIENLGLVLNAQHLEFHHGPPKHWLFFLFLNYFLAEHISRC